MRKIIQYIPAVATFLIGVGLQVSGIVIPWLGYSLMGLGVLLLLIPGWSLIKRLFQAIRQICSNVRRLRLTLKPVPAYGSVGTRFIVQVNELEECRRKLAPIEPRIINAENAISAGSVNMWLDCRVEQVHWVALDRPTFSYVVVQLEVSSRFLYDLLFANPKQIDSLLIIGGAKESENIKVADKTVLVESQPQWDNPEEAVEFRGITPIQALWRNVLYFRFNMDPSMTNLLEAYHKGEKELRLELQLHWKLKTAHNGREIVYDGKTITKCPITWKDD